VRCQNHLLVSALVAARFWPALCQRARSAQIGSENIIRRAHSLLPFLGRVSCSKFRRDQSVQYCTVVVAVLAGGLQQGQAVRAASLFLFRHESGAGCEHPQHTGIRQIP
jgi:hypothetical protein